MSGSEGTTRRPRSGGETERPCVARGKVASGVERARGRHKGSEMEPARSKQASGASAQQTTRGGGRKAADNRLQAEAGGDLNGAECGGRRATIGSASTTTLREENGSPLPEQASERSERAEMRSDREGGTKGVQVSDARPSGTRLIPVHPKMTSEHSRSMQASGASAQQTTRGAGR